jgi:alkylated DNA repair protein alkB family protein 8
MPEYVTEEEEAQLLRETEAGDWQRLRNRRVQHYGHIFNYADNSSAPHLTAKDLMKGMASLSKRITEEHCPSQAFFDQLTINDYFPGNGIPAHCDQHSPFEEVIAVVSLLSDVVIAFSREAQRVNVLLPRRSLLLLTGEARYGWRHEIAPRKVDLVKGRLVYRRRRVSFTYRTLRSKPCACSFPEFCDSQKKGVGVEIKDGQAKIGDSTIPV